MRLLTLPFRYVIARYRARRAWLKFGEELRKSGLF